MTVASSTIKKAAKNALNNSFIKSIVVCSALLFCYLINYSISSCINLIGGDLFSSIFFIIISLFMFAPVFFGCLRFFWRLLCGVSDNPIIIFNYFTSKENYIKALKLTFNFALKAFVYFIILSIPYFIVSLISNIKTYELLNITIPLWTANLSNIAVFLRSIATVGTIFLMLKYYLAPMLIIADENMDVTEAMHMSVVISKNTMLDFIYLAFSMLGWILLSLLYIPLFFTIPLFITVYLTHCTFAVSEYNEHIKKLNQENFPTFVAGI